LYSQTAQAKRQAETGFDTYAAGRYPSPLGVWPKNRQRQRGRSGPPAPALFRGKFDVVLGAQAGGGGESHVAHRGADARSRAGEAAVCTHKEVRVSLANTNANEVSRVLVVDPLEETRMVLETMLSRRGVRIVTTPRREEGLRLAREFQPDVVVLDCEATSVEPFGDGGVDAGQPFAAASPQHPPALVLIGSARRAAVADSARYVQKPYDYGPLIHTIEELLASRRAA
jgi:CheY-like chemotaxis protein